MRGARAAAKGASNLGAAMVFRELEFWDFSVSVSWLATRLVSSVAFVCLLVSLSLLGFLRGGGEGFGGGGGRGGRR